MSRMRVMTYNVRNGIGMDGTYNLERIAHSIEAVAPDLVGLQEVGSHWDEASQWEDQVGRLAFLLGMEGFMAPIYTLDPKEPSRPFRRFGCAILSRLPMRHAVNHMLTRLSTFASMTEPQPMPGFGQVTVGIDGKELRFYSTHLSWKSQSLRCLEVEEMVEITRRATSPFIVVGDYNARPWDPETLMAAEHAVDAWAVCGDGPGYTFPSNAPDRRIDYIFASRDLLIRSIDVIRTEASDHLPVYADIELA